MWILLVVPLFLLVLGFGAVILRFAISVANKQIGPQPEPINMVVDEDDWGDYPLPTRSDRKTGFIPSPTIFGAMGMLVVILIVNSFVGVAIRMILSDGPFGPPNPRNADPFEDSILIGNLIAVPTGFLTMAGLLAMMLPTSFRRSCLVTFYSILICIAIGMVIIAPIYLLSVA